MNISQRTRLESIQSQIDVFHRLWGSVGELRDGYHSFNELYEHRSQLWITVCKLFTQNQAGVIGEPVWRSQKHSDGTAWEGWFLLGAGKLTDEQITYHLPMSKWDECAFAETLEQAPPFDGHTPQDVLKRLKNL